MAGQLFLDAVLREAAAQVREGHPVEVLVLVEAGEHHALDAGGGVAVGLQALGADLLHHALHGGVDRADALVAGLEVGGEDAVAIAKKIKPYALRNRIKQHMNRFRSSMILSSKLVGNGSNSGTESSGGSFLTTASSHNYKVCSTRHVRNIREIYNRSLLKTIRDLTYKD